MNQFKRVFLGEEVRPYSRAVTVQKCLRAGGKHNDLENVGYTRRHHTFFEMLGNFSFGDYFKEDAIRFGWDFLTSTVGLAKDRMWVTVFREDDQAYDLWEKMGVPSTRIMRCGEKDNFWQMADTGPCGPCSEIHFDQGPGVPGDATPNGEGDRVIEIWNLVFMQYNRDAAGVLHPLPKPSIDTGMGLERLTAVSQGKFSNYDTDLFMPLLSAIGDRAGVRYGQKESSDRSMRVVADHLRAITFLMADGILPSNEGRGYVLRRILRRAARHGRLLGLDQPFLCSLTDRVVDVMGPSYPELEDARNSIVMVTQAEEERFISTLDTGLPILNQLLDRMKASGERTLSGSEVFRLYDTYGFPLDLMEEACREQGVTLDHAGFQRALEDQRERARKSAEFSGAKVDPHLSELEQRVQPSKFEGYRAPHDLHGLSRVTAILRNKELVAEAIEGQEIEVILDATPFYPEGGGQVGDRGRLYGSNDDALVEVQETTRPVQGLILHKGIVKRGRLGSGEKVKTEVNPVARQNAARNHTATHLVHAALRELLGPHVKQYGSLVAPNRLRFDFAHFRPLSSRDIDEIESVVNEQIRRDDAVKTDVMGVQEAVAAGALAFFGDKYGDEVRVVSIDSFSKELCGGTHCRHTGEIGLFRVVSEGGVAAGVRRIECLTGSGALESLKRLEADVRELSDLLKVGPSELVVKTKKLTSQLKEKERELEELKLRMASKSSTDAQIRSIGGIQVHAQRVDGLDIAGMRALGDQLRDKLRSGVVALGAVNDDKVSLLVLVTKDLIPRLKAGDLIKTMAAEVGGTGGGRPEMAQAGGKNPDGLPTALEKVFGLVEAGLGR
jgi:alanyl-tRNA synthetase